MTDNLIYRRFDCQAQSEHKGYDSLKSKILHPRLLLPDQLQNRN